MISTDISPKVRAIADRLSSVGVGETVSLAALSDAAGEDITLRRHLLYSAIRTALREHGAVFSCERGRGYRRLKATELAGVGATARRHIRGAARRGSTAIKGGLAGANDVPKEVQIKVSAELASLGLLEHIAGDRSVARLAKHPAPEAVADVLRTTLRKIGIHAA